MIIILFFDMVIYNTGNTGMPGSCFIYAFKIKGILNRGNRLEDQRFFVFPGFGDQGSCFADTGRTGIIFAVIAANVGLSVGPQAFIKRYFFSGDDIGLAGTGPEAYIH